MSAAFHSMEYETLPVKDRQNSVLFKRIIDVAAAVQAGEKKNRALLLFSQAGTLISVYGTKETIQKLGKYAETGRTWETQNGTDAIAHGIRTGVAGVTKGAQNGEDVLQPYTVCFVPLRVMEGAPPYANVNYGGLALIAPGEDYTEEEFLILSQMAHDIIMYTHIRNLTNANVAQTGLGFISADPLMDEEHLTTTHCNRELLKVFGLAGEDPQDYLYLPTERLIDPLPANETFWKVFRAHRNIDKEPMTITVRGREIPCIVSVTCYAQPVLKFEGSMVYITSASRMVHQISKQIGNTAVLSFDHIIGQAEALQRAVRKGRQIAKIDSNVLLTGESGSGKDVFAQALHNASARAKGPFIAVNCAALPRDLIASELFGYAEGAFTGARRQGNIGKFELADKGTIFLDEIGDLPLDLQGTLLRIVEQKQFTRLGSNQPVHVDVKIISATNSDLEYMVAQNRFRLDLFYRLGAMRIHIPPLRQRGADITELARHFILQTCTRIGREEVPVLCADAEEALLTFHWPGNVRELQNLMECIVQLYPEKEITAAHIRDNLYPVREEVLPPILYPADTKTPADDTVPKRGDIRHVSLTKEELEHLLAEYGDNKSAIARHLGISVRTLYRKMDRIRERDESR